jgi:hypothetical protein
MTNRSNVPLRHTALKTVLCATALAAALALVTTLQAQTTDNFDSGGGSLNPVAGWYTFSNPTYPATYTFPGDAFGGAALRLQGAPPSNAGPHNSGTTTARAMAVCTNVVYSDFYVATDLVNWSTNYYEKTNYQLLGLVARVSTNLNNLATGTNWSGLALFYWVNVATQNTNANNPPSLNNQDGPGTGVIGIGWVINGCIYFNFPALGPPGDSGGLGVVAATYWSLEPGHSYRLTFRGQTNYLTGTVYDTQDLTKPLGTVSGDTSLSQYVITGLGGPFFAAPPTNGWSGLCALRYSSGHDYASGTDDTLGVTDATFDNFYADVAPPTTAVSAPGTPNGETGVAQVISRTPASWATWYSPAGGITFTGSTLSASTTINTSGTRLILNGMDVSSSLTAPITTSVGGVSYYYYTFGLAGSAYSLAPNMVYDAGIILQDSLGRKTTNVWTFDTFTEAYLANYPNIECEDYDIQGGQSLGFPVPASGCSTNDNTWYYPAPGSPINLPGPLGYDYPINSFQNASAPQVGYVGTKGLQAANSTDATADYYECARTANIPNGDPLPGQPISLYNIALGGGSIKLNALLPACEYRTGTQVWPDTGNGATHGDSVGTMEGGGWGIAVVDLNANNGLVQSRYTYDTKRQKYAALNAAGLAQAGGRPGADYSVTGSSSASWWDVEEYLVTATIGSDWFNYTHDWGTATNYNVYLRNGCSLTEHLYLYTGGTPNVALANTKLGTFSCTNALAWNYRYTPLLDDSGNLAVVNVGGTTTLRLEVEPEEPQWNSIQNGVALNYLAFVPTGRAQLVTNVVYSTTNRITSVVKGSGNFTVSALGTPGAKYYLVTSGNIKTAMTNWTAVAGSTNTASTPSGTWSATVSAAAPAYYRAVAVNPHP